MSDDTYSIPCECCHAAESYTQGLCPYCIEACGAEHVVRVRTVTACAILRAVRAAGWDGIVEQTGGGTATVCIGPEDGTGRYAFLYGPGRYDWNAPMLSTFTIGDDASCIGLDDDGATYPLYVDRLADITAYLAERAS